MRDVRGLGLMVGIELKRRVAPYLASLLATGIIALPAGLTVIRLLPPLVITYPQLDRVIEALRVVVAQPVAEPDPSP
jgi:acetylornithine/LysW-gamma-L-lysine aminotransferase